MQKREAVKYLCTGFEIPQRRACQVLGFARSSYYYRSYASPQTELRVRPKDLAATRVRYGYWRLHVLLLREGWEINHKSVYRLYEQEGLFLRPKTGKKRTSTARVPMSPATRSYECWSMDFMSDALSQGRRLRLLTLVDNFSRVSSIIEVDCSLTSKRVSGVLERLKSGDGLPQRIKVDNGSECICKEVDQWAHKNGVKLDFRRPGKPGDNALIESFNGRLRQECSNQHWFESLEEAQSVVEAWR